MSLYGLIAPACGLRHSIKAYDVNPRGEWVRGDDELFVLLIQGDGRGKYRLQCRQCGHRSSDVPRSIVDAWGLLAKAQPFDLVDIRQRNDYPSCSYADCPQPGSEYHHFAPRNTFADADNWPVMPLCLEHHRQWHTQMDGYRWHRRAAA